MDDGTFHFTNTCVLLSEALEIYVGDYWQLHNTLWYNC